MFRGSRHILHVGGDRSTSRPHLRDDATFVRSQVYYWQHLFEYDWPEHLPLQRRIVSPKFWKTNFWSWFSEKRSQGTTISLSSLYKKFDGNNMACGNPDISIHAGQQDRRQHRKNARHWSCPCRYRRSLHDGQDIGICWHDANLVCNHAGLGSSNYMVEWTNNPLMSGPKISRFVKRLGHS